MVRKLYIEDPFLKECKAVITNIKDNAVFVDQTVFYPEGGGQLGDQGWLGSHRIIDTQKSGGQLFYHDEFPVVKVRSEVAHFLQEPPTDLEVGMEVPLQLDWARRYRLMQMHSAAHLAYYFAYQVFGKMFVKGCRIAADNSRFDFRTESKLHAEGLAEVERMSNELIRANLPITNVACDNEPEALVWLCGDMRIPCGGTHVKQTGDIPTMRVKRKGKGPNLERMYIELEGGEGAWNN